MVHEKNRFSVCALSRWVGLGSVTVRSVLISAAASSLIGCGAQQTGSPFAVQPAALEGHVEETALTTIRLTPEAEERLGIETVPIAVDSVERRRTLAGEVIVPPGQTITVTAPVAGVLFPEAGTNFPTIGSSLETGEAAVPSPAS